jgi:hypothetical protein
MVVTETNTVRISNEQLTMNNEQLKGNIVLTRDITIEDHTPIAGFTGKFYGNGHTVTVNGVNTAADMGLFGTVNGALVRDLTVQYYNVDVTGPDDEVSFGGIAGTATGEARIENVLVKGSLTFNVSSANTAYAGGIVALMTGTSSISNAYSGLNLTVNKDVQGGRGIYVGGVAGSMGTKPSPYLWNGNSDDGSWTGLFGGGGDPVTVEKASVVGNITVGSESNPVYTVDFDRSPESLFVGGLSGSIRGSGVNTQAKLDNSKYSGTIGVFSYGTTRVGGVIGIASQYADINECSGNVGNIAVTIRLGKPYLFVGGFIGDIRGYSKAENCSSENSVLANSIGSTYEGGDVMAGGFAACIDGYSTVRYCYAKGNVSGFSYVFANVGGFAGRIENNAEAQYCYATGDVKSLTDISGARWTYFSGYAGGFSGTSYSLSNCYALGDVFLDRIGGTQTSSYAGALVGQVLGSGNTIERCFAAGSVTIQRSADVNDMYAGGIVGGLGSNTLKNSAALGASVICTGGGNVANRRLFGRVCGSTSGTLQNNYAYSGTGLYESATYKDPNPTRINPLNPAQAHNNRNGADASINNFRDIIFWIDNNGLAFNMGGSGTGIGSIGGAVWDFSILPGRGYPILNGVGGQ